MCKKTPHQFINRRRFLSMAILTTAALTLPTLGLASSRPQSRSLSFYHTHTQEKLNISPGMSGFYQQSALKQINDFLRDFRTGEVYPIDPRLLDILCSLQEGVGGQSTIEVISGYRSAGTNQLLRSKSSNVAKRSLHMEGRAIDIRMTGVPTREIQRYAISMQRGGVGFYGKSDFVHLDTGRVRSW